jgi:hypothetical protein
MANPLRAPRASGAEFGAAPAQALESAGGTMYEIGERIQKREENAISDQALGELDTQALPVLSDFEKKHDIAMPEALGQFESALQKIKSDALSKTNLRPEARAALERQLDNQITQYGKSAIGMRIKAGHAAAAARIDQQFRMGINQVTTAPVIMNEVIGTNLAFVESRKDSMDPLTYQTAVRKAQAGPIQAAVNAYSSQEQWDQAEKIITDPLVNSLLEPDVLRSLRIDVAVGRGKQETEVKRQDAKIAQFTSRLGRPLTPDEVARIRTLPAKKDMTPADEITELELVQGKPASQDQVDKIFKTYIDGDAQGGSHGNSLTGRAMSFLNQNASAYANRTLSPEDSRRFEMDFTHVYGGSSKKDPVTDQWIEVKPSIPGYIREAMERGGSGSLVQPPRNAWGREDRGAGGGGVPRPGDTVQMTHDGFTGRGTVDANGKWSVVRPDEGALATKPTRPQTIWEMADDIAGPAPAVAAGLGSTPVIGSAFDGGGKTAENRQYVRTQISQMIDALSINPRNPVALVEMIRKEINVDPKVMDDPSAYRRRIEGVTRALTERLKEENEAGSNPDLPIKTRQDALDVANTIGNFLQKLMPPVAKNADEFMKLNLKSGDKYIDGKGDLYQVP